MAKERTSEDSRTILQETQVRATSKKNQNKMICGTLALGFLFQLITNLF